MMPEGSRCLSPPTPSPGSAPKQMLLPLDALCPEPASWRAGLAPPTCSCLFPTDLTPTGHLGAYSNVTHLTDEDADPMRKASHPMLAEELGKKLGHPDSVIFLDIFLQSVPNSQSNQRLSWWLWPWSMIQTFPRKHKLETRVTL